MPWFWPLVSDALKFIPVVVGGLMAVGGWLIHQREARTLKDQALESTIRGAPSLKTLLDSLDARVGKVESRMDHANTHISDLGDDYQRLIGKVTVLEAQIVDMDRARAWLFDRVTELLTRRR